MKEKTKTTDNALKRKNEVFKISRIYFGFRCLAALVSGMLMILAFPCFNFSYLAWITIIPLYILVFDLNWRRAFVIGFLWGYAWSVASTIWLRNIETFIPFAISFILAFFYAFWAVAVPVVRRYLFVPGYIQLKGYNEECSYLKSNSFAFKEIVFTLCLSCLWCVIEWVRTWIFTGLPWNLLAISQWQQLAIIQIASVTGIYGVSFILVFMNLAIADTGIAVYKKIKHNQGDSAFRFVPLSLYISIMLILAAFHFGINRAGDLRKKTPETVLRAAVVQGDIPQCRFFNAEEAMFALKTYTNLSEKILPSKPDILIWPESAVPQSLRGSSYLSYEYRENIEELTDKFHIPILLGTTDYEFDSSDKLKFYNSAYLINKNGEFVKRYNKMHLVPWGEYTPFENIWPVSPIYPWIKEKFGMGRSCTPGTVNTIFKLKKNVNASVLICYEDIFPKIARKHVLNGANLLLTITNDAWFPTENQLEQHLAQAVFRAVENNRVMIRNGNCAGSCVIQPNGFVSDSIFFKKESGGKFEPDPAVKGRGTAVFNVGIREKPETTFYTKYGNLFILFCGITTLIIFLCCSWNWKAKKTELIRAFNNRK
ncbi:MAG: apolipoprotein N-acyltransferase [Victivallales bacterium]|nr:apolipoprotein N-acyltransferase [Victivallales bacterium]